ncbi:probable phosphocarrier protein HPr protein (component of the phosphoenolpyruvate-dependent sugarphosphotransferase [alpha proteobacterium BAL199]|jgi:phosphocarrier protein HPr|nr:probable phosphocarrier protein HPr protein (component of the phosphoenolpyruvate-dependent sugarphosphotransferase [alpha proteobacterium BAL199]
MNDRRVLLITNKRGLHARAAAKFVQCAGSFDAEITVTKDGQSVSGRSIMGLMMLAAAPGSSIEVTATGSDAQPALEAITQLVDGKFDED